MKTHLFKRVPVMVLAAALLLTVGTQALFGWGKEETAPEEGAPTARDLEIATYRGIPYEAQLLATGQEGETLTFAVEDQPRKGTVVIQGDRFTYTPDEGVTGSDSFTYTATDNRRTGIPARHREGGDPEDTLRRHLRRHRRLRGRGSRSGSGRGGGVHRCEDRRSVLL